MSTTPVQRYFYGTGRRKSAVARVRLFPGNGEITVNGKTSREYFGGRELHQLVIQQPLQLTNTMSRFHIVVKVVGGGSSGQAGAVRHGISRALCRVESDEFRPALKKAGLLTRDARVKERKKVGLKRARKAPQYTKR
jgi:small subunit ribosomal protein S9